ncbi:MAG: ribosome biogenesis GTPase YlqF [Clostridia bacterium]|nr:ribosome biogenesis GTPase YlqF [Clostridia bacterium]
MKHIQWFPGHMTKAMRMMEENVAVCDGIIYVLDARCPAASYNPKLKKMAGAKPILYVLNKSDLADANKTDGFIKLIQSSGAIAVKATATGASSKKSLMAAVDKLVEEKRKKSAEKGYNRTFRFMVVGVPNTGKSTVINLLAGSKRAITGDKAGVTKSKQWIRCGTFELLDTPGTMPPAFENQYLAMHLAFVGSINDDILDFDDVALKLLEETAERYPKYLNERYGIEGGLTPVEMLEKVCLRRGFILKGKEYDYERGERAVVDDFRKGRLGYITLDLPEDAEGYVF